MLLRPQYASRSCESNPTYEVGCWKLEVFHSINANQRARSAESSFTVDGECSTFCLRNSQELGYYAVWRRRSINKVQVGVIDAITSEFEAFVLRFIQSDHMGDAKMLKDLQVVLGAITALLRAWRIINGTHEGYESIRNDPVKISILHFFVVLVLLVIKIAELVPSVANRYL